MKDIYILKKHKLLYGPYSLEAVRQRGLKPTDLVWFQGLTDWTPVENIDQLIGYIKKEQKNKQVKKTFFEKMFRFLN